VYVPPVIPEPPYVRPKNREAEPVIVSKFESKITEIGDVMQQL